MELSPTPFGSKTIISDLTTKNTNIDDVRAIVLSDQNILDIKGIELGRFSSLSLLNLTFNSISTLEPLSFLPPSSYSPFLTSLNVSHNKLTTLSGVESLPSLKVLRASNNKLEEVSSLCKLPSLEELWLSRNSIDSPQFLNLLNLSNLSHFVGSHNPWCSHERYKNVLLSMLVSCETLDCRPVTPDDLYIASEFAQSTDGKGVFHKLKFTILQSENKSYFMRKLSDKEAKSAGSRAAQAGRRNLNIKRYKNSNDNSTIAAGKVVTNPKDLRLRVENRKEISSTSSPTKRGSPSVSPIRSPSKSTSKPVTNFVPKFPKPPPGSTLLTASISDCLSLLPNFGDSLSKMKEEKATAKRKARKRTNPTLPPRTGEIKFKPVSWQGSINVTTSTPPRVDSNPGVNALSPRVTETVSDQPGLLQGTDDAPHPVGTLSPRPYPVIAPSFKTLYTKGGVGCESKSDGTAYAKYPSGGHAVSRDTDRVTCSYVNGRVAVTFDSRGNGSVYYPDGKTALSMSTQECLWFKKVEGTQRTAKTKFDIVPLNGSSGVVRIPLNQSLGVDFCVSPLRIELYFKVKNVHCKFVAPGTEGGAVVVGIEGKGDIWGEKDRVKKVKKKVENLEHGDLLSAIQRAVAEL